MRSTWQVLGLVASVLADPLNMEFYSPELQDDLIISRMPNAGPVTEPGELKVVDHVLPLKKGQGKSLSSMYVEAIRAAAMQQTEDVNGISRANAAAAPLAEISGSIYTVPITIGSNTYQLVVDTGSSDPWLASSTFTCLDPQTHTLKSQDYCYFGPLYDPTQSTTFQSISNQNFNVSYADGENLNGYMGYETFTIAGITVTSQEFGVVTQAAWYGDGTSSGLVGFAYSSLTSAYAGTNPQSDVKGHQITYSNLFNSIYARGLTAPIFSLALTRDSDNAGIIAIGGIPNIPHSPYFATTTIQPVGINATSRQLVYQFYSIIIDGWAWSSSQNAQFDVAGTGNRLKTALVGNGTQVIVDSGTSLIYAPNNVVAGVAASFNPPATYNSGLGSYTVSCTATAPLLGVSISKKIFYVNPVDLFIEDPSGFCYLGIQPNQGGLSILGDVWMKSVLAVFDIGAEQMRFAAREFYSTPACSGTGCVTVT